MGSIKKHVISTVLGMIIFTSITGWVFFGDINSDCYKYDNWVVVWQMIGMAICFGATLHLIIETIKKQIK